MICPRCGTEHDDPEKICPRCGYGRPRIRKPMPVWARWTSAVCAVLLAAGIFYYVFRIKYYNSNWMDGSWEGGSVAITFNADERTFLLSNGDLVLTGNYIARKDSFELQADDGNIYVYRYTRIGTQKMKLMFTQDETTVRITVTHMNTEPEEPEEEEEPGDIDEIG